MYEANKCFSKRVPDVFDGTIRFFQTPINRQCPLDKGLIHLLNRRFVRQNPEYVSDGLSDEKRY